MVESGPVMPSDFLVHSSCRGRNAQLQIDTFLHWQFYIFWYAWWWYVPAHVLHHEFNGMKLYAVTVLFKASAAKPKKLSAAYDLSSFGFFQRSR